MKKSVLAISIASLLMFSCNKNKENTTATEETTPQTTQVEEAQPEAQTSEENNIPYLYKAENGDIMEVNFLNDADPKQVNVKLNGKEYTLNQTQAWAKGAEYANDEAQLTYKQETASLKVGDAVTNFELISPLTYTYSNGDNSISVTYFSKNNDDDKRYVTIRKDGAEDVTLEQTEAWAKGASYGNGNITWTDKNGDAVLTDNGAEVTYKRAQ